MPYKVSHGVSLAEDRLTVVLQIATDTLSLSVDLDTADVDILIDALTEMRRQMVAGPPSSN
jgi:hypothetical protein